MVAMVRFCWSRRCRASILTTTVCLLRLLPLLLSSHLSRKRRLAPLVLLLLLEDIAPGLSVLALPTTTTFNVSKSPSVAVPRVRARLELEASLNLKLAVSRQVTDIPQSVRLALEERHHDRPIESKELLGAGKELHEKFLIEAHLSVDICAFATDVREVEEDVVEQSSLAQCFVVADLGRVDVVEHGLAFFLEVVDVLLSLRLVLLVELCLAIVAGCRDVAAAVVLDYGFCEREVAFAD